MKKTASNWFATWFDTPYYHTLYKNRDYKEAQDFMSNLTHKLGLNKGASILDVACGRGRHSVYLNKLGYNVTGIDLSQNSIDFAKTFENDSLKFKKHDMCVSLEDSYDAVFNLFTSFGYFEKDESNVNAIKAMRANMKANAYGVIDFLNIDYSLKNLNTNEAKTIDGIQFEIEKWVEDNYLFKKISFSIDGENHMYTERLKCIDLELFKTYLKRAELELKSIYGDYTLSPFDKESSERLILVFTK